MENFNNGGGCYRSNIIYPPKNRAKGSYEDCEEQVECNSGEKLRLSKIISKVMKKINKRSENNVPTNVKNINHKENDGERQNYSYMYKGIQYLKCKDFEHV